MLVRPGRAMSLGAGRIALWQPLSSSSGHPDPAGLSLSAIPALSGWWDAGTSDGFVTPSGNQAIGWNQAIGSVTDRSGENNSLVTYSHATPGGAPRGVPRLSGTLGGVGRFSSVANALAQPLDPDLGWQLPQAATPWSGAWTWYFVWSRPNWRQGSGNDAAPVTLLSVGTVPLLQADSQGGTNRLILFPGPGQAVLTHALSRRHTHSIVVRSALGGGVDAWLDGALVATGVRRPQMPTGTPPTLFLHDGTGLGAAQCWFHEAASWSRPLAPTEIEQLLGYANRWFRGNRRSVLLLIDGQSNAINYALNDGAAALLAQGVAWHIGALTYGIVAATGNPSAYTMQSGHGIYAVAGGGYPGSFLQDPANGSDPSIWSIGTDGQALQQMLGGLAAEDASDICAIVWPWNETDSLRTYSELTTFTAAASRFLMLERAMLNKPASNLPLIWWNAIPYGTAGGMQMHREAVAAMASDPARNVAIGNPQTSDSNPRGSTWSPTTGLAVGGDIAHRDSLDNQKFARLAAPVVAQALIAAGSADSISSIPTGLPAVGGPKIVHVYRESDTSLILTLRHDAGTDVRIPLQAAQGVGFAVMDGGSVAQPGAIVAAGACVRVDATHLRLTLARPLTAGSNACALYYPYGGAAIGRGNAVTDNYGTCPSPGGWDIAADLGPAWKLDFPLAATFAGLPLSDSPL